MKVQVNLNKLWKPLLMACVPKAIPSYYCKLELVFLCIWLVNYRALFSQWCPRSHYGPAKMVFTRCLALPNWPCCHSLNAIRSRCETLTLVKEAWKGFSLLYCWWNEGPLQRRMFYGVGKLQYMSPCNSIVGLYFKGTCDVISVTMATHKVHKSGL